MTPLDARLAAIFDEKTAHQSNGHAGHVAPSLPPRPGGRVGEEGVVVTAAEVEPQEVAWLWPERFALGKLSMVVGDPDKGKSLLTLDMAARVSTGRPWPDAREADNPPGDVLLLGAEDDLADTIRPRLDAARADCRRVHALTAKRVVTSKNDATERGITLDTDLPLLRRVLSERPYRLLIIDPISAFLGDVESHNNAAVRGLLAPLSKLANDLRVAIIAVAHLNKATGISAIYRTSGSLAFPAAARSVMAVGADEHQPGRRLFVPVKNNLSPLKTGLAFEVAADNNQPRIHWAAEPVTASAEEVLNVNHAAGEGRGSERKEAIQFLKAELADGPVESKTIFKNAVDCGISKRTLFRASKELMVRCSKSGMKGGWYWSLPAAEECHQ